MPGGPTPFLDGHSMIDGGLAPSPTGHIMAHGAMSGYIMIHGGFYTIHPSIHPFNFILLLQLCWWCRCSSAGGAGAARSVGVAAASLLVLALLLFLLLYGCRAGLRAGKGTNSWREAGSRICTKMLLLPVFPSLISDCGCSSDAGRWPRGVSSIVAG